MKTFKKLQIGERFWFGVDADGHEPYMWKVSNTEAYVECGSGAGTRRTVDPDTEVEVWGEPVTLHDAPTEVERAALTLLLGPQQQAPNAEHPGLNLWIDAMLNDPEERRSLDRFIWEEEAEDIHGESVLIREACREMGYVCWESEWDRDNSASGAILSRQPSGSAPQTRENHWWAAMDEAAYRLASAVRDYRVAGRPAGDYTSGSVGGLGTLGYVETSLAAAITEFHWQVVNVYASEKMDLEMALHSATPDDLITQTEAAQIAHITPQAVNNAIRDGRLRAYSDPDAVAHRAGDRRVSEAAVRELWPPREQ